MLMSDWSSDVCSSDLSRLNMDFFLEITAMTGNAPLREISERLYFQTSRIWLLMTPRLNLAEEFANFRREMEDILAAAEAGDMAAVRAAEPRAGKEVVRTVGARWGPVHKKKKKK